MIIIPGPKNDCTHLMRLNEFWRDKLPNSKEDGMSVIDIDFIIYNMVDDILRFKFIEMKTKDASLTIPQYKIYEYLDNVIRYGCDSQKGTHHFVNLLEFENSWFDDGYSKWNNESITEEQVVQLCSFGVQQTKPEERIYADRYCQFERYFLQDYLMQKYDSFGYRSGDFFMNNYRLNEYMLVVHQNSDRLLTENERRIYNHINHCMQNGGIENSENSVEQTGIQYMGCSPLIFEDVAFVDRNAKPKKVWRANGIYPGCEHEIEIASEKELEQFCLMKE